MAPIFGMLSLVCVPETEDVQRWASLGVDPSRITVTGSIKFDPQGSAPDPAQVEALGGILQHLGLAGRPLLLAASTHPGEEAALATVYLELKQKHPDLGLLAVPRHFERGAEVVAELKALGLHPVQRSKLADAACAAEPNARADVLVIDSTGELKAWQEHATIVIMGKSFLAKGGQNPAEAVMAGKPVVFGPHMENFEAIVRLLLRSNAAIQVASIHDLAGKLSEVLTSEAMREQMAKLGHEALAQHVGATGLSARLLAPLDQHT